MSKSLYLKYRTIDTPKMVNIFILYVSTLHLSHLQKNATYIRGNTWHSSEDDLNVKSKRKE